MINNEDVITTINKIGYNRVSQAITLRILLNDCRSKGLSLKQTANKLLNVLEVKTLVDVARDYKTFIHPKLSI
tara:strand:+ start:4624 stop:4842 length:219 start_codon:yes stop_codon:yes gene_type:complete